MTDPPMEPADGVADQGILDRSEQAARFLDLARHLGAEPDDAPELIPLIAARLQDARLDQALTDLEDEDEDEDGCGDGNGTASAVFGADDDPLDPLD